MPLKYSISVDFLTVVFGHHTVAKQSWICCVSRVQKSTIGINVEELVSGNNSEIDNKTLKSGLKGNRLSSSGLIVT